MIISPRIFYISEKNVIKNAINIFSDVVFRFEISPADCFHTKFCGEKKYVHIYEYNVTKTIITIFAFPSSYVLAQRAAINF